ncbi:MAG: methylmalonyl-CoA mutase [Planctomycetota bacterium]
MTGYTNDRVKKNIYFSCDIKYPQIVDAGAGSPPYLRGIYPNMYTERLWTMRQYSGFGDAKATNERFKYLLKTGQTGLSLAFDLPTQMGYDPDNPCAIAEVGKAGVSIATQEDFNQVLEGINLEDISLSMTINATAPVLMGCYYNLARSGSLNLNKLSGTVQNDILKEFIARNTYTFPPQISLQLAIDIWEFCAKYLPKWHFVSVSGYHIREKGASAVQELAFTFSNAFCYIDYALKRGLDLKKILERISFFFSCDRDFFEEIAKFRAGRVIWHDLIVEKFGKEYSPYAKMRFHVQTAGSSLTFVEPENNIVRVTMQALAAVLGGAQSIHTNSYDEAISLPSPQAVKLALRTQQILAHELGIPDVVDPLGGSFYLESLTSTLITEVKKLFYEIEKKGGALKCILNGFQQKEIENQAYKIQKEIEDGKRKIIGVNFLKQTSQTHEFTPSFKINIDISQRLSYIRDFKNKQERLKVRSSLEKLKLAVQKGENSINYIADCLASGATLEQIVSAISEIYGKYFPES